MHVFSFNLIDTIEICTVYCKSASLECYEYTTSLQNPDRKHILASLCSCLRYFIFNIVICSNAYIVVIRRIFFM